VSWWLEFSHELPRNVGVKRATIARFCRRLSRHPALSMPFLRHEQRQGGICENCGIDFLKYVTAVVAEKQTETDAIDDRLERRSTLLKNVLWVPLTGGSHCCSVSSRPPVIVADPLTLSRGFQRTCACLGARTGED